MIDEAKPRRRIRVKTEFNPEFPLYSSLPERPQRTPAGTCPQCGKPLGRRDGWFYSQDYRTSLHFDCLAAYAETHGEPPEDDDDDENTDENED